MKKSLLLFTSVFLVSATLQAEEPASPPTPAPNKPNPAAAFKKMDTNSDGKVDKAEFVAGKKNPEKAASTFAKKDKNADGSLTLEEFMAKAPKAPDTE